MNKLIKIISAIALMTTLSFANDTTKVNLFNVDTNYTKIEADLNTYTTMHKASETTKMVSIASMVLGGLILSNDENNPVGGGMMALGGVGYFVGWSIEFSYTNKLNLKLK